METAELTPMMVTRLQAELAYWVKAADDARKADIPAIEQWASTRANQLRWVFDVLGVQP